MDIYISLAIGIVTGWCSNLLWYKWQNRRKDTHLTIETDSSGMKFSGRFNADVTADDDGTKDILSAINSAVNKTS
ncbi:hypothetical protein CWN83_13420 [Vibrio splendidus]|nr:hypothetical protein CWN83_13420 [Vibrio splendidus]